MVENCFSSREINYGNDYGHDTDDDSDIDKIEVGVEELNYCDFIGTPNFIDDENENDPQNLKNEKSEKPQVRTRFLDNLPC